MTDVHYIAGDSKAYCGLAIKLNGTDSTAEITKVDCDLCRRTVERETFLLDNLDKLDHKRRALVEAAKLLHQVAAQVEGGIAPAVELGARAAIVILEREEILTIEADDRCNEALDHLREFGDRP